MSEQQSARPIKQPGLYFSHPACLEHDPRAYMPEHPDTPERLLVIEQALAREGWLGWERREAPPASESQLQLSTARAMSRRSRSWRWPAAGAIDPDTFVGEPSYRAALHAAGGACEMTRALVEGEATVGFCGVRPSGHHAEPDRAMGFCLFNNVAIAAEFAICELGVQAGIHPRLGRASRQRHRRGVPPSPRRPVREHPPVRDLPGHRPDERRRVRPRRGLHDQPSRPGRLRGVSCGCR